MKKVLSVLSALALAGMAFTACVPAEEAGAEQESEDTTGEAKWDGEIEPVVVTFLHGGTDNADMDQVEAAINDYIRDKIGVEIKIKQVSVFNAASQYTMWLGGGETVDLMTIAFAPVSSFTAMNMLQPIEDYLDSCPDIENLVNEGYLSYCPSTDGHIYGVGATAGSLAASNGNGMYFWKEDLDALGDPYQDNEVITMDQLDELVRKVKELHPDSYVGVYGSAPRSGMTFNFDPLGADITSGVLLDDGSTKVVDYFETDAYKKYIDVLSGWYQSGIVKKDAATTDSMEGGSMTSDPENCRMMFNSYDVGIIKNYESVTGKEIVGLRLTDAYTPAVSDSSSYTCIPVTAEHPEAALRFLNLLYSDKYVYTTWCGGIEGLNYEYNDAEHLSFHRIDDAPYVALGVVGDTSLLPQEGEYDPDLVKTETEFAKENAQNHSKGYGFMYDPTNYTNQITAIDAVLSQYRATLETGSGDTQKLYDEFIAQLKQNGIDDVIADKQAQFDAWLAKQ